MKWTNGYHNKGKKKGLGNRDNNNITSIYFAYNITLSNIRRQEVVSLINGCERCSTPSNNIIPIGSHGFDVLVLILRPLSSAILLTIYSRGPFLTV